MKIPLAGVIGCPIGHSRSPILHGTWLRAHGLRGHYVPLHVEAGDLAAVLRAMPAMGFVGANVTLPHKEAALALADMPVMWRARSGRRIRCLLPMARFLPIIQILMGLSRICARARRTGGPVLARRWFWVRAGLRGRCWWRWQRRA
jgi:hypothetical protein